MNGSLIDKKGIDVTRSKKGLKMSSVEFSAIPLLASYPVLQHEGREALPVVKVGDRVEEGMILAKATTRTSVNVHSAVPGVVKSIEERFHVNGKKMIFIDIATGGRFRVQSLTTSRDYSQWTKAQILSELSSKGVVELSGDVVPLHLKWSLSKGAINTLIVDASQLEPYMSSDYRLLVDSAQKIIGGLIIASQLLEPKNIVFATDSDSASAGELIVTELKSLVSLKVDLLIVPNKYPHALEKLLFFHATGIRLKAESKPEDLGGTITNIATLVFCYEALAYSKPMIEKLITFSGKGISKPSNLVVKLGTPIKFLIEECGGLTSNKVILVAMGVMQGYEVVDVTMPITKEMVGIVALVPNETKSRVTTNCIGCTACARECPLSLAPKEMYYSIMANRLDKAQKFGLDACISCGICSFHCPSRLELSHTFHVAQQRFIDEKNQNNKEKER